MSGPASGSPAMANGANAGGRQQANPAELVGSQFVSQFYTVLHSSPNYLYRFYTDESTVTHADGGSETDPPSSVTVATQKSINERVSAMGFQEATTEIWSVDSQYSKDNGVMVLVTGSLQCKGKKKRDFVQSFFLAVQEKGYFVLNDTFRYLSVNHARLGQQAPRENGYHQAPYEKGYHQSAYSQPQSYYPGHAQPHPQPAASSIYTSTPGPTTYSSAVPPVAAPQPRPDIARGHAVTPSILPTRTTPLPPKPVGPSSLPIQPQQPQTASPPAPPEIPSLQSSLPETTQASTKAPVRPPPAVAAPEAPTPEASSKPETTQVQPEASQPAPTSQAKAAPAQSTAMSERKESKTEALPVSSAEETSDKAAESSTPSAPLTYAERLKLGPRAASANKQSSLPKPITAPASALPPVAGPSKPTPKAPEPAAETTDSTEAAEAESTPANGTVTPLPEETLTTSIFVRNLPDGTTQEKLEQAFARFGNIKSVSLRPQKGKNDFAFVEFDEVAAMQAAVEAKVIIDGKTVTVMERKPLPIKHPRAAYTGGDRGGRGEGRGFRPGRDGRGRNGRGEGRQYSAGRGERTEGRESGGGRGRSFSGTFNGESRIDGSKQTLEGRGEGGRGRGEGRSRGRSSHSNRAPQPSAQGRSEQA